MRSPEKAMARSSSVSASRKAPPAFLAMIFAAPGVKSIFSAPAKSSRCALISSTVIGRKRNVWQRLTMVAGTLCFSVVARIKTTWAGGSSMVFNSALKELAESICTSSRINTLKRSREAARATVSIMASRTFSTCVLLAASSSSTSISALCAISRHCGHLPQGSGVGLSPLPVQFNALAKMRAVVVLPQPRGP